LYYPCEKQWAQISEIGTPNTESYSDTTVSPLTTYRYRVYAYNTAGSSGYSNEANASPGGTTTTVTTTTTLATTTTCMCEGLWADAADLGNGWYWLDWFGYFVDTGCPICFIWHIELGWMFCAGTSIDNVWCWSIDEALHWLWINESTYPYMYRAEDNAWLWYVEGTTDPAWFMNLTSGEWEAY
ncbi:hypothetical protein ACFLSJ_08925, partial [Verrucomicrobiota bacterium]